MRRVLPGPAGSGRGVPAAQDPGTRRVVVPGLRPRVHRESQNTLRKDDIHCSSHKPSEDLGPADTGELKCTHLNSFPQDLPSHPGRYKVGLSWERVDDVNIRTPWRLGGGGRAAAGGREVRSSLLGGGKSEKERRPLV
ncbi:hypothetical protein HPG69_002070 [Diceros bicornis minor]|uniref:Uncharacterized protein n=1 Tax=Diceros bicornis minor TaxID=77932 RepID=A0A7J7FCD1_DICBM|nr:hypothetical protein HPG69_002070 [Diceros bicornis minor]